MRPARIVNLSGQGQRGRALRMVRHVPPIHDVLEDLTT